MNTKELRALEQRIQKLEDIEAIKDLKARYAAACDDKYNPEKMGKLFTRDAVWDGGKEFGAYKGRAAIKRFFRKVSKDIVFAAHYFVQPVIKVRKQGDTATAKWYVWMTATLKGNNAVWVSGLEYDKYRKVDGVWLMSEMRLKLFFMTPYEQGWHKTPFLE